MIDFLRGSAARLIDLGSIVILSFTVASWFLNVRQLPPPIPSTEAYDPSLISIKDVNEVTRIVRAAAPLSPYAQAKALEDLLRYRFYHGYSRYSFSENWLAWLAARTIHSDLDAKVLPEQILDHPWAACSQQAIVVQTVLRKLGIRYATVEWPGHFTTAAMIGGEWLVVDPWGPIERDRSRLWRYEDWVSKERREAILGPSSDVYDTLLTEVPPVLTKIDRFPAENMAWFHPLTLSLSRWLWGLALGWGILRLNQVRRTTRRQLSRPTYSLV